VQPWTWGINGLFKLKQFDYSHRRFADFKMDLLISESLHRWMCRLNFSCSDHADLLWGYPQLIRLVKVNQNWSLLKRLTKESTLLLTAMSLSLVFCLTIKLIVKSGYSFFLIILEFPKSLNTILVLSNHTHNSIFLLFLILKITINLWYSHEIIDLLWDRYLFQKYSLNPW